MCPRRCQCPKEPPACLPGVPLILDDCACCLVCAAQKGQVCSEMNPCDTRKGLQCDYTADVHKRTGICVGKLFVTKWNLNVYKFCNVTFVSSLSFSSPGYCVCSGWFCLSERSDILSQLQVPVCVPWWADRMCATLQLGCNAARARLPHASQSPGAWRVLWEVGVWATTWGQRAGWLCYGWWVDMWEETDPLVSS